MEQNKIYVIQHKETLKEWSTRAGKACWRSPAAAKNAWANAQCDSDKVLFDEQSDYEIVEVREALKKSFNSLLDLTVKIIPLIKDEDLKNEVESFIADYKSKNKE